MPAISILSERHKDRFIDTFGLRKAKCGAGEADWFKCSLQYSANLFKLSRAVAQRFHSAPYPQVVGYDSFLLPNSMRGGSKFEKFDIL